MKNRSVVLLVERWPSMSIGRFQITFYHHLRLFCTDSDVVTGNKPLVNEYYDELVGWTETHHARLHCFLSTWNLVQESDFLFHSGFSRTIRFPSSSADSCPTFGAIEWQLSSHRRGMWVCSTVFEIWSNDYSDDRHEKESRNKSTSKECPAPSSSRDSRFNRTTSGHSRKHPASSSTIGRSQFFT